MKKKVYGIAGGDQGYGSGDIFEAVAWQDSTREDPMTAQDLEGNWVEVYGMFFIDDNGVPQQSGWSEYIPQM